VFQDKLPLNLGLNFAPWRRSKWNGRDRGSPPHFSRTNCVLKSKLRGVPERFVVGIRSCRRRILKMPKYPPLKGWKCKNHCTTRTARSTRIGPNAARHSTENGWRSNEQRTNLSDGLVPCTSGAGSTALPDALEFLHQRRPFSPRPAAAPFPAHSNLRFVFSVRFFLSRTYFILYVCVHLRPTRDSVRWNLRQPHFYSFLWRLCEKNFPDVRSFPRKNKIRVYLAYWKG